MDGTGTGSVSPGTVGEFPGADVPFGMLQWSPDTTPDLAGSGGGYSSADSHINGFSLTHLSGTGCPSYGDVPILPTVGPVGPDPVTSADTFSHGDEEAAPGRYRVTLGPTPVTTELSVTTRTGIARFVYPHSSQANLLFKVADSANPVTASRITVQGPDLVTGSVTSGQFCGTGTDYTLYFAARFDRAVSSVGSWSGSTVTPGSTSCTGTGCGAYVTFDTDVDRVVVMKVGISFVSIDNAEQNLASEDPGWSLSHVEAEATGRWNGILGRIRIGGGTAAHRRTFYTALYHSLLFPNVVSDANGDYTGDDGRVHRSAGRSQYADFSEWDIYRSEIELVALLAPHQAGDMVQSLVNDQQQGGWLPKWAIVDGDASQMNGDSADPIIAAAYAFGVRGFDMKAALAAMVKGATQTETGHGLEIERQYLDQYLSQHYVDAGALDLTSIDYSIGASVTLEYAIDDFSIAQMAEAEGDSGLSRTMMGRAHNWEYLFDPANRSIQARGNDGSFPAGAAFQAAELEPGGQLGFEEGNAVQYTWSVPQDIAALAALMGGDTQAVGELDATVAHLNAGRDAPYDWAGNEPSLWTPWEFDYLGAPERTQEVVRQIADTQYAAGPVDEPGNDDLGALSSWYVWAAIGLYPVTPGSADLALASPLFPATVLTLPDGRRITMVARGASAGTPYVHSLRIGGADLPRATPVCAAVPAPVASSGWDQPWVPSSILRTGATMTFGLSSEPSLTWGDDPGVAPPSFGGGRLPALGYSLPGGGERMTVGRPTTLRLGLDPAEPGATTVTWTATGSGLAVSPSHGVFVIDASAGAVSGLPPCTVAAPPTQAVTVSTATAGTHVLQLRLTTSGGTPLPPVDVDLAAQG
jgi:predicted alpha-1,2-mannosidase